MAVIKHNLPEDIKISFTYGCAIELICSLHVVSDPGHHTNCIDWYDSFVISVEKKLVKQIVDFGAKYANWSLVMDLIDDFTKPPSPNAVFIDDFSDVMNRLDELPREEFVYVFLGETLLGGSETAYDLLQQPEHLKNYDLEDLYKYIDRENVEYFIRHVDETKEEMKQILNDCYHSYFKAHWKKTCAFYRGAIFKEKRNFSTSLPVNFIVSLHDNLSYENNALIMKKEIDFKVRYEKIREIKVILSAFTYPHLMINIYNNRISIYRNLIMPNMSTDFDDMARSIKVFCDSTRLSMVKFLLDGEMTNQSLSSLLNITPASVSQHLKLLKQAGLLYAVRRKNSIFYSVNREEVSRLLNDLKRFLDL